MSHYSKIFTKTPVKVPNSNGFDKSFEHLLSQKVGTLVPVLCDEVIPGQKIELGCMAQVQLPPMATDFYGRIDYKLEAFFVPGRLLFGGFEDVFTHNTLDSSGLPSGSTLINYIPGAELSSSQGTDPNSVLGLGSLADYLGLKVLPSGSISSAKIDNILPFMAYHLIWSTWYRDARIQVDPFAVRASTNTGLSNLVAYLPYTYKVYGGSDYRFLIDYSDPEFDFLDNVSLFSLRQRNFSKDRFTNATLLPQAGTPSQLSFGTTTNLNTGTGSGSFTIASLRAANALQQWLELNNYAGARYGDQQLAEFGVRPESFMCDRPVYLGSHTINIYNRSVYSTQPQLDDTNTVYDATAANPFKALGTKGAASQGVGDGSLISGFRATERGYLMVMASIVPHANYSSGINPMFRRYRVGDFAHPLFQGLGDEPIYNEEVQELPTINSTAADSGTFGYTQRYSSYKYKDDVVSGLLRDAGSLESFALKRSFYSGTSLGSQFLEIPTDFLDQVTAVSGESSQYGAWADVFFKYKVSMPLSAYTIPTLGDMKDTHTQIINSGGTRL